MSDSSEKSKAEFHTDMPVGEILRRGREHFGQSLEDVERNLRIRAIQLHALETGNIDQLPGKAYALGFVRSYSEYLGLDGEKMVQLFKRQSLGTKIQPNLHFPTPASESKLPGIFIAVLFAALGILAIWGWMSYSADDRAIVAEVPPVSGEQSAVSRPVNASVSQPAITNNGSVTEPAETDPSMTAPDNAGLAPVQNESLNNPANIEPSASVDSTAAPDTNATAIAAVPLGGGEAVAIEQSAQITSPTTALTPTTGEQKGIILNVKENSWVEIRDTSGQALVSRVLKAGDQYYVPDRPDLRMSLGNASGVEIVIDGVALPYLGARGEVKQNISLDSKSLKALAGR